MEASWGQLSVNWFQTTCTGLNGSTIDGHQQIRFRFLPWWRRSDVITRLVAHLGGRICSGARFNTLLRIHMILQTPRSYDVLVLSGFILFSSTHSVKTLFFKTLYEIMAFLVQTSFENRFSGSISKLLSLLVTGAWSYTQRFLFTESTHSCKHVLVTFSCFLLLHSLDVLIFGIGLFFLTKNCWVKSTFLSEYYSRLFGNYWVITCHVLMHADLMLADFAVQKTGYRRDCVLCRSDQWPGCQVNCVNTHWLIESKS